MSINIVDLASVAVGTVTVQIQFELKNTQIIAFLPQRPSTYSNRKLKHLCHLPGIDEIHKLKRQFSSSFMIKSLYDIGLFIAGRILLHHNGQ